MVLFDVGHNAPRPRSKAIKGGPRLAGSLLRSRKIGNHKNDKRENLKEAVRLVLEANKQLAENELAGKEVIREKLAVSF